MRDACEVVQLSSTCLLSTKRLHDVAAQAKRSSGAGIVYNSAKRNHPQDLAFCTIPAKLRSDACPHSRPNSALPVTVSSAVSCEGVQLLPTRLLSAKRLHAVADVGAILSSFFSLLSTNFFANRRRQPTPPPPAKPTSEPTADNQPTLRRETAPSTERQPTQPTTPQPTARHTADRHGNTASRAEAHPPPQPTQRTARHAEPTAPVSSRSHTPTAETPSSTQPQQKAAHLRPRTASPAKPTTATTRQTDKPHNKHPQTDRQNTTARNDDRHGQLVGCAGGAVRNAP